MVEGGLYKAHATDGLGFIMWGIFVFHLKRLKGAIQLKLDLIGFES